VPELAFASEWLEGTVGLQPEYRCRRKGALEVFAHSRTSEKLTDSPFRALCGSQARYAYPDHWCLWSRNGLNTFLESIHFCFLPVDRPYLRQTRKSRNGQKESILTLFVGGLMHVFAENLSIVYRSAQVIRSLRLPNCQYGGETAKGKLARHPRAGRAAARSI
jgi:hypothetical protein